MQPTDDSSSSVEIAASRWLARRDRGLTPAEQDRYLQWLRESPAHGAEIARLEAVWQRFDALHVAKPAAELQPNPDLLAPPRRRRVAPWVALGMAAAVAVSATATWQLIFSGEESSRLAVQQQPEQLTLADGSMVELNVGAKLDVNFSAGERAVRLVRGEAHFVVAKDASRPFVVSAGKLAVRAIGTAFAVQMQPDAIAVTVTEGAVHLAESVRGDAMVAASGEWARLSAGQQAIVRLHESSAAPAVRVRDISAMEIERALAWQTMRLEFSAMPLRAVIAEFNRFNSRKLVIDDAPTGEILVGGTFRADNVDSFVRLLDAGFGVSAQTRGDEIVLRRR